MTAPDRAPEPSRRIGILAGGGTLPISIAEAVTARGGIPYIVAIEGEADQTVTRFAHAWVNWGQVGRILDLLRHQGGGRAVIAGHVRRPDLKKLRPDAGLIRNAPAILAMLKGGDDHVLTRVVRFFEANGIEVRGVDTVAPNLKLGEGAIDPAHAVLPADDVQRGLDVIAAIGGLDVGQAVVVRDGRVIAIEGVEGTDAMLARVSPLAVRAGVLVKAPKPGQERRVDLPTLGPRTVECAAAAGLAAIAAPADQTLLLDRAETIARVRALGCAVVGLPQSVAARAALPTHQSGAVVARVLGRHQPQSRVLADVHAGLEAQARLSPFGAGDGVIVARQHILAVTASDTIVEMIARAAALRQWGSGSSPRRRGVLIVADWSKVDTKLIAQLIERAAAARLEGVALAVHKSLTQPADHWGINDPSDNAVAKADEHGLFLLSCRPKQTT